MLIFQDFEKIDSESKRNEFIYNAVSEFRNSKEYKNMELASKYFNSDQINIEERSRFKIATVEETFTITKQIATSNFFFRLITQQNQFLLSNGMQIDHDKDKDKLGLGFDTKLQEAGEFALIHGISWLFYNVDHVEIIKGTNFIPIYDEFTMTERAGIHFWQIDQDRPIYARLFELDGITWYKLDTNKYNQSNKITLYKPKEPYKKITQHKKTIGTSNYNILPVVPLKANDLARSELTQSLKSKIDMYDIVLSDFGDNLQKTNSIYWVLENFGGDIEEARALRAQLEKNKMLFNTDEGKVTGVTMQVPHEARAVILELLESGIYRDFMGINLKEITGGSLTNVAIDTAQFNLSNKVNRFEFRVYETCQKLLELAGIVTENIKFQREFISNKMETMQMLYMCRADIDLQTALEKNPIIETDEVERILKRLENEEIYNGGKFITSDVNESIPKPIEEVENNE